MKTEELYKSVLDMDRAPVVICSTEHIIMYMNAAAVENYKKYGGNLVGRSLLDCHNEHSVQIIKRVLEWFSEDKSHNMIYTFKNEKKNKDVYMVALRDENGELIGYYEKHEFRDGETAQVYDFSKSLV